MIGLRATGFENIRKRLKDKEKALTTVVDKEMAAFAADVNAEQKRLAPVDFGFLRSSLQTRKVNPLEYEIVSIGNGSQYAPYQEFGTGGLVDVPSGLEQVAQQYKGKGVRRVNMKPQPFFFRPFLQEKAKFIKKIEDLLK